MKKMKLVLLFFLVLTIAIGGSGCMNRLIDSNSETVDKQVIHYLENKYNENFYIKEAVEAGIDVQYDEIYCYSEMYPEKTIVVYWEKGKFTDNYYKICKYNELHQMYEDVIRNYISDYKFYIGYASDYFTEDYLQDTPLEKALKNSSGKFSTISCLFIKENSKLTNEQIEEMCTSLANKNLNSLLGIYYFSEEEMENISESTYREYLSDHSLMPDFSYNIK